MARKRMIEPDIWSDEGFVEMSDRARLLFIGLISQADDEGRGTGSAKSLKAKVFPSDDVTREGIEALKEEVQKWVSVEFYEIDGKQYYQLERWKDHQSIDKKSPSHIPAPREYSVTKGTGPTPEAPSIGAKEIQARIAALGTSKAVHVVH